MKYTHYIIKQKQMQTKLKIYKYELQFRNCPKLRIKIQ